MKHLFTFLLPLLLSSVLAGKNPAFTASVSFYSEDISFHYDPSMVLEAKNKAICTRDNCLKSFYQQMKEGPSDILLNDLMAYREQLALNDWLYCKLVRKAVDQIYAEERELHRALTWWFLLNESGYDVRLTISDLVYVFLYAPSEQKIQDVPYFTEDGKMFYNLTAELYDVNTFGQVLNKPKYIPNPEGKSFSFGFEKMPLLKPEPVEKKIVFQYMGEEKEMTITIDNVIKEILADYPMLEQMDYLKASLSPTLDASLRPQLEAMMEGKTEREALEVLAAFTRTAFAYKWDWDVYDEEQPMFAEQIFHSAYSDHEDRCALYFYLVRELLDLPILVLTHYNNNMTLAVAIEEEMKRQFDYKGVRFTICDPTHPRSSCEIDRFPNGLTNKTVTVVGEYNLEEAP